MFLCLLDYVWSEMKIIINIVLRFRLMVMIEVWNGWFTLTKPFFKQKHLLKTGAEMRIYGPVFTVWLPVKKSLSCTGTIWEWTLFLFFFFSAMNVNQKKGFKNVFFFDYGTNLFFFHLFDFQEEWSFPSLKCFFLFSAMQTCSVTQNLFSGKTFLRPKKLERNVYSTWEISMSKQS